MLLRKKEITCLLITWKLGSSLRTPFINRWILPNGISVWTLTESDSSQCTCSTPSWINLLIYRPLLTYRAYKVVKVAHILNYCMQINMLVRQRMSTSKSDSIYHDFENIFTIIYFHQPISYIQETILKQSVIVYTHYIIYYCYIDNINFLLEKLRNWLNVKQWSVIEF